jgi:NOL1/NOP2/fmu family ribosome biogenesis protein
MERTGVTNAIICDESPQKLARTFGPIFDRVLLDAPCSGESLFRRVDRVDWSPAIVTACARRQAEILDDASALVRPGGILAYATCTFSPEENEEQLDRFLSSHPDFSMKAVPQLAGFDSGKPSWVRDPALPESRRMELSLAVRLWPHRFPGEGHFVAIMQREASAVNQKPPGLLKPRGSESARQLWQEFQRRSLTIDWPEERLHQAGERLYLLPETSLDTVRPGRRSLHLLRYGLLLGEAQRGYFKPAHTLAMALSADQAQQRINWPAGDPQLLAYLQGRDLPESGPDGWVMVTVDGFPLGWGKRSGGRLKNHYPRGLRRPA